MNRIFFSLGLMSGTSMDGIDVSIIKSDGEGYAEVIDDMYLKYDNKLRSYIAKIVKFCFSKDEFIKLSRKIKDLEKEITLCHSKACKLILKKNENIKIDLIGFHGQTLLHKPEKGYSIQIGDSHLLSKITKTTVVSNFRDNDILNGGQGAPLSPLYHQLIMTRIKSKLPSAIINIGGISNITYMESQNKIISFDIGPGNYLIDGWIRSNTKMEFDKDGVIAKSGQANKRIINKFLKEPYYKKIYPKSLDVKDFNFKSLKKMDLKDGSATLSMLTVQTICNAINSFVKYPNLVLVSGGGRKNKFIIDNINKKLKKPIILIDRFGLNGDFIESQAFAYLAVRSYLKKFITLPTTTGVKNPCAGGMVFKN